MTRPSVYITISLVFMNLFTGALMATGVAQHVGVDVAVGGDQTVDQSTSDATDLQSSAGVGDTLFAMYHATSTGIASVFSILPAFSMLRRAGVPSVWVGILVQVTGFIIGIDIAAYLKGFNL